MLALPHMEELAAFVTGLRRRGTVPDFDPLDGGVRAEALFLLEKPGRLADRSGFISRDNADPTAAAIGRFMAQAGLGRERTVLWNVVPWWNGTVAVTAAEVRAGLLTLPDLLALLPAVRAVVLVGQRASSARDVFAPSTQIWETAHPSPNVRAAFPERWRAIPVVWQEVRAFLDGTATARA